MQGFLIKSLLFTRFSSWMLNNSMKPSAFVDKPEFPEIGIVRQFGVLFPIPKLAFVGNHEVKE
jgi:hypothetical protein